MPPTLGWWLSLLGLRLGLLWMLVLQPTRRLLLLLLLLMLLMMMLN
jgi:hypothetical protein